MYVFVDNQKKVMKQQIIDLDGFNFVIQPSKKNAWLILHKTFHGFWVFLHQYLTHKIYGCASLDIVHQKIFSHKYHIS